MVFIQLREIVIEIESYIVVHIKEHLEKHMVGIKGITRKWPTFTVVCWQELEVADMVRMEAKLATKPETDV